jgi:DUF1365 family protein
MAMESAIYSGTLTHRRFEPARHEFTYPLFMAFLDVDRIPELMKVSPFSSYERFNWASFRERDHFGDPALTLRERMTADAAKQGILLPDGPIFLLTNLCYLGYNFNPISLFYCYNADGELETILAEVNSTFGESRNYWLTAANQISSPHSRIYRCPKAMHVSPFMPMELDYRFVLPQPGEQLMAHMNTLDGEHTTFDATLSLQRAPWSATSLRRALLRFPWVTAKVVAAIHWEALRLYFKKVPVFTHPARRLKDTHDHTSDIAS